MRLGLVNGVVHMGGPTAGSPALFGIAVSETAEQVLARPKSKYWAAEMSPALLRIRGNGRRYLFIGVPCHVKAVRLLCRSDPVLAQQIVFCFALVCGHLKTPAFAELLAWQMGMPPEQLTGFDFRPKDPAKPPGRYSVQASAGPMAEQPTRPAHELYGSNWGHVMFQPDACDACDDVMGELADVTFGDAWLPRYDGEWRGTNIVVTRSAPIDALLAQGQRDGQLQLDELGVDEVVASQAGNYRHRWDGLSVRTAIAQRQGRWFPHKRIRPGSIPVDFLRQAMVQLRMQLACTSHTAFRAAREAGRLEVFMQQMQPLTRRMRSLQDWCYRVDSRGLGPWLLRLARLGRRDRGDPHADLQPRR